MNPFGDMKRTDTLTDDTNNQSLSVTPQLLSHDINIDKQSDQNLFRLSPAFEPNDQNASDLQVDEYSKN